MDTTAIFSLLAALSLLVAAYVLSLSLLPASSPNKFRVLFVWHAFDALVHFIFEGSFLYNCFFTYAPLLITGEYGSSLTPPGVHFLERPERVYGSSYGSSPLATLWQEYAKADRRWGGADLTVISIELLTVFGAGPLAFYICELLRRGERGHGSLWFWCTVLATGELYGGFMTFAPEWLTGSTNLDTSNFMYLWVYLVFFNCLWVAFPLYAMYEAYHGIQHAFAKSAGTLDRATQKKLV